MKFRRSWCWEISGAGAAGSIIGPESSFFQVAKFFWSATRVYSYPEVTARYQRLVGAILEVVPCNHPAALTLQLANEPTPLFNSGALERWAEEQTRFIRKRNPAARITLGRIGEGPLPFGTRTDLRTIPSDHSTLEVIKKFSSPILPG